MSSHNWNTRDQERAILKLLTTQHMITRQYLSSVEDEWMRSEERKYILELAKETFADGKKLLSQNIFDFAIKSSLEQSQIDSTIAEWNLISGGVSDDHPDALIEIFKKSESVRNIGVLFGEVQDIINSGDADEAINRLKQETIMLDVKKEKAPIIDIRHTDDRRKLINDKKEHPDKYMGIKSGFRPYDNLVGGFFDAELVLVAAVSGVGKSTFMKMISFNIAQSGKTVLHVTNEENQLQVLMKYDSVVADIEYNKFKNAKITEKEMDNWESKMSTLDAKVDKKGTVLVQEIEMSSNALEIERVFYEYQTNGVDIDIIVVDYLDHMLPVHKSWSENDEQGKAAGDLKALAISCNVPVITATQASTGAEAKQTKGKKFGKMDVYGSKRKVHVSNVFMAVRQERQDTNQLVSNGGDRDEEWECDWIWAIDLLKNRDGSPFSFGLRQQVKTGRVVPLTKQEMLNLDEFEDGEEDENIVDGKEAESTEIIEEEKKGRY